MSLRTGAFCWRATSLVRRRYVHSGDGDKVDPRAILEQPSWLVATLLPGPTSSAQPEAIDSKQLHHLLRLAALPPPRDAAEEKAMLATLSSQLHFVREVQNVDTTNIEPLRSLRDETAEGRKEAELGLDALREALAKEQVRGKHHQRIRRRSGGAAEANHGEPGWDVLGGAERKVGRFFVVSGERPR